MSAKKTIRNIMCIVGSIFFIIFVSILWNKVVAIIGDGMWTFIIVGIIVLLFIVAGFLSKNKFKEMFG